MPLGGKRAFDVVVIGSGIAGCFAGWSHKQQGKEVILLEAAAPASGASGNPAAALYPFISQAPSPAALFYKDCLQQMTQWLQEHTPDLFKQTGLASLAKTPTLATRYATAAKQPYAAGYFSWQEADWLSETLGLPLTLPGLWLPTAGWVRARALCEMIQQSLTVHAPCQVTDLQQDGTHWQIHCQTGPSFAAQEVVIANSYQATQLAQTAWLPLRPVRGQIAQYPEPASGLSAVLCCDGYIIPEAGAQTLGATYQRQDTDTTPRDADVTEILKKRHITAPALPPLITEPISRASIRAEVPDHLPLIGRLPKPEACLSHWRQCPQDRKSYHLPEDAYYSGLSASLGHGSRGFLSAIAYHSLLNNPTHRLQPERLLRKQS